jgi:hypothetical protein
MSPQRSDLVLTADIPNSELNVLILDGFDVKPWMVKEEVLARVTKTDVGHCAAPLSEKCDKKHTDSRDCCDDFTKLQLVQDGCLSGGIKTNHENTHLLLSP